MWGRFVVICFVMAAGLGLLWLQNKVMVGDQELFAAVEQEGADRYEILFKDLAGNLVPLRPEVHDQIRMQVIGALAADPSYLVGSPEDKPTEAIILAASPEVSRSGMVIVPERNPPHMEDVLGNRLAQAKLSIANPERDLFHLTTGIDLRGGVEFVCGLYDDRGRKVPADDEVVSILRRRLDARGLTEPQVYRLANGDVQVIIPGGTQADAARTRKVLETTGRLEVSEVARIFTVEGDWNGDRATVVDSRTGDRTEVFKNARGQWRLADRSYYPDRGMRVYPHSTTIRGQQPRMFYLLQPARLTGAEVDDAMPTMDEGKRALSITFTTSGGAKNRAFTTSVKERGPLGPRGDGASGTGLIAFSLDGIVESAPRIIDPSGRRSLITGNFTEEEVSNLRTVLKAGSLTVKPVVQSQRVVGPSLGKETVERGVEAMLDALLIIIVFILGYYWWRLGVVAVAGLATCIGLVFVALSIFGATLTLPGLAGLVLTVGMAVDANILIFERIREENQPDTDKDSVIQAGFGRAFLTIFDASLTTFLTAGVLYFIGSGPVKGFGLTLMVGIATSMFAALYVGRFLVEFLYKHSDEIRVQQWVKPLNLPYVSMRMPAFLLSAVVIVGGLSWFAAGPGGVRSNFDIDFTGGNMVHVSMTEAQTRENVLERVETAYAEDPEGYSLLKPSNITLQPYFSQLGTDDRRTRQFMFKVRDDRAAEIEVKRAELVDERGQVLRDITRMAEVEERRESDPELLQARSDLERLNDLLAPIEAQLAARIEVLEEQLLTAFAGLIPPDGSEIVALDLDGERFRMELETLDPASETVRLQVANQLATRPELADLSVEPLTGKEGRTGLVIAATMDLELVTSDPDIGVEDPVRARIGELLPEDLVRRQLITDELHTIYNKTQEYAGSQGVQLAAGFISSNHFSPQVAEQMQWRALMAMAASLVVILFYLAGRFEFRYGVGAIVALVHDILITVGLIAVFGIRIDLTVVAALLTIVGYSLNDTIIVYDRIRELRKSRQCSTAEAIDPAVAMTFSRTALTSGTTIFATLMLSIFGGAGVSGFANTMLIGLVVGTYSSIFIASPALLWFKDTEAPLDAEKMVEGEDGERPDDAYEHEPAFQ